jgi:NAD(P)-dependent dehydrogenase (short-subunit alcohol dehydrogenase family)
MSRVAVVTGAASGIGLAVAKRLAQEGHELALIDRVPAPSINAGARSESFVCDVTDDTSLASVFDQIRARFGRIDLLVPAAGIGRYAPFLQIGASEWRDMFAVNVMGVVGSIRGAIPAMVAQGSGRIIVIGSRRGLEPTPDTSAYSATKAALHGLARSLALEVAPHGIHVCLLCPGGVRTGFRDTPGEQKDDRFMDPETIADAVAFMAGTPDGAWVRELDILPLGL